MPSLVPCENRDFNEGAVGTVLASVTLVNKRCSQTLVLFTEVIEK